MKTQIKKFIAFIILILFTTIITKAQCQGNKVLMHRGRGCIEKCVPSSQFDKYISQGWIPGPCPINFIIAQKSLKMPNKTLVKVPGYNNKDVSKGPGKK
jgi:hypothetical protein